MKLFVSKNKRLLPWQKPLGLDGKSGQIAAYQLLQKLVPIQLADHAAGIVVVGDISGILREEIANDLVDGVITLFVQSVEHTAENATHIVLIITRYSKLDGISGIVRHGNDLLPFVIAIIAQY